LTNPNPDQLGVDITNNSGSPIIIQSLFVNWADSPSSQNLTQIFLNGASIWNTSDPDSPSTLPDEGGGMWPGPASDRTIPNGASQSLTLQFQEILLSTGYQVQITFDNGCQVSGSN
jgi:hypothetical protein